MMSWVQQMNPSAGYGHAGSRWENLGPFAGETMTKQLFKKLQQWKFPKACLQIQDYYKAQDGIGIPQANLAKLTERAKANNRSHSTEIARG